MKNDIDNLITTKIALGLQNSCGVNGRIVQFTPGARIDSMVSGAVAFIGVKGGFAVNVQNEMVLGEPETWRFYFQPMGKESHHLSIQTDLVRALRSGTEGVRATLSYFTVDYTMAGEAIVENQQIKALNNKAGSLKQVNFSVGEIYQAMGCPGNVAAFEYHSELSIQDQYASCLRGNTVYNEWSCGRGSEGLSQVSERGSPIEKKQRITLSNNRCLLCWCGSINVTDSQPVSRDRISLEL